MRYLLNLIILALCIPSFATTYFISSSTGSDANTSTQAQSKFTPWAHVPGMASATGNLAAYTPVAGDTFTLMGCDVWGSSNFTLTWIWSGTIGSHITIGVDQTWFNTTNCPTQWNRPVFDAQNTQLLFIKHATSGCTTNINYVDWNWIELTNLKITAVSPTGASEGYLYSCSTDFVTASNFYIHHWTYGVGAGDTDNMIWFQINGGNSGHACEHCKLDFAVVDNTDGAGTDCGPGGGLPPTNCGGGGINVPTQHSVITGMTNAFKSLWAGEFAFNNISKINQDFSGGGLHPNCFEVIAAAINGTSGVFYFHDNWIHNTNNCEGGQTGNTNENDYIWNNIWDMEPARAGNNGPGLPQQTGVTNESYHFWNNTVIYAFCITSNTGGHGTAVVDFYALNNQCIGGSLQTGTPMVPTGTKVISPNSLPASTTIANSQGYSSGTALPWVPTSATCNGVSSATCTVGNGTNLTAAAWVPSSVTFPTVLTDIGAVCTEATIAGVLRSSCTARANTRPASGVWDAGAYQFAVASISQTINGVVQMSGTAVMK